MKNSIILVLSLCATFSLSAQWGKQVKGNGNVVTEERSVGEYQQVSLSGSFDVELVDGKEGNLTLKGDENLLEYLITEVKDGKLVIKVKKGYYLKSSSWKSGGILITVPVEEISAVSMSGSGDIVGKKTLRADDFDVSMSGSGDIKLDLDARNVEASLSGSGDMLLSGASSSFTVRISGSGDIEAYDLEADDVEVVISGSADAHVTARKSLLARVSGSGDVHYKGNPEKVDSKTSGSGEVTKG
ncbi:head GIN domain-containing protein [Robiginitalea sp. IMCC44478]|uniref:head GIN domain-containing protein n=1 Tax=Robiginitalea sp. IMCC44478 TaxID=3459122 RepID=UPI0040432289